MDHTTEKYESPVSVYDDSVGHIHALVRSIICLSLEKDPEKLEFIGGGVQNNAKKIPYPFLVGCTLV